MSRSLPTICGIWLAAAAALRMSCATTTLALVPTTNASVPNEPSRTGKAAAANDASAASRRKAAFALWLSAVSASRSCNAMFAAKQIHASAAARHMTD
eukprot:3383976-Prymnesium_polylepis.1